MRVSSDEILSASLYQRKRPRIRGRRTVTVFAAALAIWVASAWVGVVAAQADHWAHEGWAHLHRTYPTRPNGLSAINSTFGSPCNSNAYYNQNIQWPVTMPSAVTYTPKYHKKLGGDGDPSWFFTTPLGGSSNVEDVYGHLVNDHAYTDTGIRGGLGNYNCRYIGGTTVWSTHAWGIAFDINWSYEHDGHCHSHTVLSPVSSVWQNHNWYWGYGFCDAMHFQYATGY